jgi:peptidoglycan/xylan/chitin deacetylase (PgdA/CDA1 family)
MRQFTVLQILLLTLFLFHTYGTTLLRGNFEEGDLKKNEYGLHIPYIEDPFFLGFTFDDNGHADGLEFIVNLFSTHSNPDGSPSHFSFYVNTNNIEFQEGDSAHNAEAVRNKKIWRKAIEFGHEIGLHTHSHPGGRSFSENEWKKEIQKNIDFILKEFEGVSNPYRGNDKGVKIERSSLWGFRAPFLQWNDDLFYALDDLHLKYDSTFTSSSPKSSQFYDSGVDHCVWPYLVGDDFDIDEGFWEVPVCSLLAPPIDNIHNRNLDQEWVRKHRYSSMAYDWNLFYSSDFTKEQVLSFLKYNFDLRRENGKCPMVLGLHSDIYSENYGEAKAATLQERREVLIDFMEYALQFEEVRFHSSKEMLEWIKLPIPIITFP